MKNKPKIFVFYIPGALALLLFLAIGLSDFWTIGVTGDSAVVEHYHFGNEAMITHGGQRYRSANAYAASGLIIFLVAAAGLSTSLMILGKTKDRPLIKAYICTVFSLTLIMLMVYF